MSLIVVDIVTTRTGCPHAELVALLRDSAAAGFEPASGLSAAAYRPIVRGDQQAIDCWLEELQIGRSLPTLPLALNAELALPIDLDATYCSARARRRLGETGETP
jgi:hypothetical protein